MLLPRVMVLSRYGNQVSGYISLVFFLLLLQNGRRLPLAAGYSTCSLFIQWRHSDKKDKLMICLGLKLGKAYCPITLYIQRDLDPTYKGLSNNECQNGAEVQMNSQSDLVSVPLVNPIHTPCPSPPPWHGCGTWWPRSVQVCTPTPASAGPPSDCRGSTQEDR